MLRRSVATKISLVFIPAAIIITVIVSAVMLGQLTQLYRTNHQDSLESDVSSAKFLLESYLSDIRRSARIIAESTVIVNAVKEEDSMVASVALRKVLQAEGITFGFILTEEGKKVFSRSHNPLMASGNSHDPFLAFWSALEDQGNRKDFLTVFPDALRKAELPNQDLSSDEIVYLAAVPIKAFGDELGLMVIGKELGRDPLLNTRLEELLRLKGSRNRGFALMTKGALFQELGALKSRDPKLFSLLENMGDDHSFSLEQDQFNALKEPLDGRSLVQIVIAANQHDLVRTINSSLLSTAIIVLLGVLFLIVISQILLKRVIQPIRDISRAAAGTAKGQFTKVRPGRGLDEVATLANSYNNMVAELESNTRNLTSLLEMGRHISMQNTVEKLARAITEATHALIHPDVELRIAFRHAVFVQRNLKEGYYCLDRDGHPQLLDEETLTDFTKLEISALHGLMNAAFVYLRLKDEATLKKGFLLLKTLSVNVASAIDSIQLASAMDLIKQKTLEIETIFNNITQGICQIDQKCEIVGEYSHYLETILGRPHLKGLSLFDTIFHHSDVKADVVQNVAQIINNSIGEDALNFYVNRDHLPRDFNRYVHDQSQILELDWSALIDGEDVVRNIMVTVRDVTLLRRLREEAETQGKELQKLMCILSLPHSVVADSLREATRYIDRCEELSRGDVSPSVLAEAKQHLHSLKGVVRRLNWMDFAETVHKAEDSIVEVFAEGQSTYSNKSQLAINSALQSVFELFNEYQSVFKKYLSNVVHSGQFDPLFERIVSFCELGLQQPQNIEHEQYSGLANHVLAARHQTMAESLRCIERTLPSLAKELSIPCPRVQILGQDLIFENSLNDVLIGCFTHLVRNSLFHGFRSSTLGVITIQSRIFENLAQITYSDNGQGLDMEGLRKRGQELQLLHEKSSEEEVASVIFKPDVSTAKTVTQIAGRGMGMDAVKSYVESMEGHVELVLEQGHAFRPFQLIITFPSSFVLNKRFLKLEPTLLRKIS